MYSHQKSGSAGIKAALGDALRVHTNFRIRPVVVGNMFRAAVCDVKNPPLFKEDGRVRHMGTADTRGLMLYVTYDENHITLHFFHGLSDFRGFCAFLNTMLRFYFHKLGKTEIELPEPDSKDAIPGTSFIDWGHYHFDEFYVKDLRRLRKKKKK